MPVISNSELNLVRTFPQDAELTLSMFRHNTILACQVNNSAIAKGARTIAFNNVTSGSYLNVKAGMTLYVGSYAGARDIGTIRIRSITSSQMIVAENSDILWANGLFLTVIDMFGIYPIFPRIVVDQSNPTNITFYKDYDIAYTNQNNLMGTFICMGSHRQLNLDANGQGQIYYTSTGTTNVNGENVTYAWWFQGAFGITGSTAQDPGFVTYKTPGYYLTSLTTTSTTTGAVDVSYRYIIVEREGGGIKDWKLNNLQGNRQTGGYNGSITIYSDPGFEIVPGMMLVLSVREDYGNTRQNVGGLTGQSNIFFVGYVLDNSVVYDYDNGTVDFQIGTVSEVMKLASGFAISIEDTGSTPATWYQINGLNLKKAMYHFWRWHSTVLYTSDVQYLGTDWKQQFYDSNKESIFDAVNSVLKSARFGELVCDRNSKLWAEISVAATPGAITAFPAQHTISKDDWMGSPNITVQENNALSYLELGGIYYRGPGDGNTVPYLSEAPGASPAARGKFAAQTGLSLQSQAQLNALAGDIFWNKNARYQNIKLNMRGAFKNFDIAPQLGYTIIVNAADTPRNIAISGTFYPGAVSYKYDHKNVSLLPTIDFKPITDGPDGDTLTVPTVPAGTPAVNIPPLPQINPPSIIFPGAVVPPTPVVTTPTGYMIMHFPGQGIWAQDTIGALGTWFHVTSAWTPTEISYIRYFWPDLYGNIAVIAGNNPNNNPADIFIMSALAAGGGRTQVWNQTLMDAYYNPWHAVNRWGDIYGVGCDFSVQNGFVFHIGSSNDGRAGILTWPGGSSNLTQVTTYVPKIWYPTNGNWWLNVNQNKWFNNNFDDFSPNLDRHSKDFLSMENSLNIYGFATNPGQSIVFASQADIGYFCNNANSPGLQKITANGTVATLCKTLTQSVGGYYYQYAACDPTGQYVMCEKQISSNYGVTWTNFTNFPSLSYDLRSNPGIPSIVWNYGDGNKWLVAFTATVYDGPVANHQAFQMWYTADGGASWTDAKGDILAHIPTASTANRLMVL